MRGGLFLVGDAGCCIVPGGWSCGRIVVALFDRMRDRGMLFATAWKGSDDYVQQDA